MSRALSFLWLFTCSIAMANDSASFRLDRGDGSMVHVQVRDQGHYNDCYANAAAEMIDAWRFSHGDRRTHFSSSALKLAIDTASFSGFSAIMGSTTCTAINTIRQHGALLCNDAALRGKNGEKAEVYADRYLQVQRQIASLYQFQDQLQDLVNRFRQDEALPVSAFLPLSQKAEACHVIALEGLKVRSLASTNQSILAMLKLAEDIHGSSMGFARGNLTPQLFRSAAENETTFSARKKTQEQDAQQFAESILQDMRRNGFNARNLPTLQNLINTLKSKNDVSFLSAVLANECKGANSFPLPRDLPVCQTEILIPPSTGKIPSNAKEVDSKYAKKVRARIDSLLRSEKSQPITISFCDALLPSGKDYSSHISTLGYKDCSLHAALLIGRRVNPKNGRTEYLLRNSFGSDCKSTSKDFECLVGTGNTWMDAEALARNTYQLQWF